MYWMLTLWTMSAMVFLILPVTMITTGSFRMARRFLLGLLLHTLFMTTIQAKLDNTLLSIALNIWLGVILNVVLTTALHNIPQRIRTYVIPYVVLAVAANLALHTVLKLASNTLLKIVLSSVCYPLLNLQILHLGLYSLATQSSPSTIFYHTFTPHLRRLILHYNLDLAGGYFTDPYRPPKQTISTTPATPLPRPTTPPSPTGPSTPRFCTTTRTTYTCGHTLSSTTHTPSSILCLTTRARSHCRTHTSVGCGCPSASARTPSSKNLSISADELCKPILNTPVQSPEPCPACSWRRAVPDRSDWVLSATGRLVPNAVAGEKRREIAVGQSPSPSRQQYVSPPRPRCVSPPRASSPPPTPLQRTRFT